MPLTDVNRQQVLTGVLPFSEYATNTGGLTLAIVQGVKPISETALQANLGVNSPLVALLASCWDAQPTARPPMIEAERDIWHLRNHTECMVTEGPLFDSPGFGEPVSNARIIWKSRGFAEIFLVTETRDSTWGAVVELFGVSQSPIAFASYVEHPARSSRHRDDASADLSVHRKPSPETQPLLRRAVTAARKAVSPS